MSNSRHVTYSSTTRTTRGYRPTSGSGHISYDPKGNSVGEYAPTFERVDPNSFSVTVDRVLADRAARGYSPTVSGGRNIHAGPGPLDAGVQAFLQQIRTNNANRYAQRAIKNGGKTKLKGTQYHDLSPEVRTLYDKVTQQEHKAGIKKYLGEGFSVLGRALDILSRPNYAIAESVKEAFDAGVQGKGIGSAFSAAGHGFVQGIEGKKKTFFADDIQHVKDVQYAAKKGLSVKDALAVHEGYAPNSKKASAAKYGVGFLLDVALDPTTYLGVGEAKVALKAIGAGKDAVKGAEVSADVSKMADRLFSEYGVHSEVPSGKHVLEQQIAQPHFAGRTGHAGEARAGRIADASKFVDTVKATVAAKETGRKVDELTAARANEFITPPVAAKVESSPPKWMDVPTTAEDHQTINRYASTKGSLNSQKARLSKQINDLKIRLKNVSQAGKESIAKKSNKTSDLISQADHQSSFAIQKQINSLEAEMAKIDGKLATNKKWFDDHFNVSDQNVANIKNVHKAVNEHPDIQRYDELIRAARDEVRKATGRADRAEAAQAKRTKGKSAGNPYLAENAGKKTAKDQGKDLGAPSKGPQAAQLHLHKLIEAKTTRQQELYNELAAKMYPDKGTLVAHARQLPDIGKGANGIVHALDKAILEGNTEAANIYRREMAYRFAEKGDKWFNSVARRAPQSLRDELKTLTPLERPGKHTLKKRVFVVEHSPVEPAPSDVKLKAIEAHNAAIAKEIQKAAESHAADIANKIGDSLMEMMVRESSPNFKRGLAIKIGVPLTGTNNPAAAKTAFVLALPDAVSNAVGKYIFRDTFKEGMQRYAKWFQSSAGSDPLLNQMRLSYKGAADKRIEVHADRLRATFLNVKPAQRVAALRQYLVHGATGEMSGPYGEIVKRIDEEVNALAGMFKIPVGESDTITRGTINRFLPDKFKLQELSKLDKNAPETGTAEWLKASIAHIGQDTDPAELLWHLNIAREKVLTKLALKDNIRGTFGIERTAQNVSQVAILEKKGYKTVPELGPDHLFPPEVADDVAKSLDLLKNEHNVNDLIKFYDKVLGFYKSSVTVWNPSYHFRNSFGDAWMNYLRGVSGPEGLKSYSYSGRVLRAMKGMSEDDPVHMAIMSMDPAKAFETTAGSNPATRLFKKHGKDVTAEEVWVLYNHYGLHTGFVSNEFGANFAAQGSLRATRAGELAGKANRALRSASESREDYFRLAHFIHVLRTSKVKDMKMAGAEAAASVRKYMFDYSDFTQIEKQVIVRAIPFYKWTRKALPLMIETLFAQPGKALMYPKAMRSLSGVLGYPTDGKGSIPGSDLIIPEWVSQRGMFPLFSHNGNTVMGDIAVPFNDIVRTVGSPKDNVLGMASPLLRAPAELAMGKTFYQGMPIDSKLQYLLRSFPQSSFVQQMVKKNQAGELDGGAATLADPRTLQFLSGIGLFENTKTQQKNALLGRQADATAAITKQNKAKKGRQH